MSKKALKPKVVILAGGMGMRLKEETEYKPKPMILVGPHPILWHIMKIYMQHGFNEFIICLGYKGDMIKEYFLNFEAFNNDFTLEYGDKCRIVPHRSSNHDNFKVTLVDTGIDTMTGGRLKLIEKYVDTENFMFTYGDGVSDINVKELYNYHIKNGKIGTVTGVHPESRFGELIVKENSVLDFSEKPQIKEGFISGGFFVLNRNIFKYIEKDCFFEKEPMEKLTKDKQLNVYKHTGYWQCMDTYRDLTHLNDLWNKGKAPWKTWK
jgi:glucose-1-phosphate cytidylyltransferase